MVSMPDKSTTLPIAANFPRYTGTRPRHLGDVFEELTPAEVLDALIPTVLPLDKGGTEADLDGGAIDGELIAMNPLGTALEGSLVLASDLVATMPLLNGAIVETIDIGVSVVGGIITFSLQKLGGGDLNVFFGGSLEAFDSTPAATVALTAGTDVAPTLNYVYLLVALGAGPPTLQSSTVGWPGLAYAPIAQVYVQSVATTDTYGPLKVHAWTDHIADNLNGHLSHLNRRVRELAAAYASGVDPSDLTSSLYLSTTAGVVSQMHPHVMPAITMDAGPGDSVWAVNDPTTAYLRMTALSGITQDADGTSITNKYFNVVLWGVVSEDEADCKLFINLPSGIYTSAANATGDVDGTANYAIPAEYAGCGFLIARYTLKDTAGTLTQSSKVDLRGLLPSTTPGGGVSTSAFLLLDGSRPMTGDLDLGGNDLVSGTDTDVTVNPDGTGATVLKKLEPRYRNIRVPFQLGACEVGDIVCVYVAGHSGAGAKAPYAKLVRWAVNVEGATVDIDINLYIRPADARMTGGTKAHTTDKTVTHATAYNEYSSFDNDAVDSTADGSADDCVLVEVMEATTPPDDCDGWVELEIQD